MTTLSQAGGRKEQDDDCTSYVPKEGPAADSLRGSTLFIYSCIYHPCISPPTQAAAERVPAVRGWMMRRRWRKGLGSDETFTASRASHTPDLPAGTAFTTIISAFSGRPDCGRELIRAAGGLRPSRAGWALPRQAAWGPTASIDGFPTHHQAPGRQRAVSSSAGGHHFPIQCLPAHESSQ
ncbi:hypothetical protein VUR80DRAFT_10040 [Thermomyces stellatus]